MKRSNKPIFWSLFGAGGMLSALIGPALVFTTGIALPLGGVPLGYERAHAFAQNGFGKVAIFLVISLFLFHGLHRMYHSVHDLGIHVTPAMKALFHGIAALGSAVAAYLLVTL
ncbi:MAG TPA: fumarate reductase subunit FrdD [Burkholderiales bacterium]|nr:fumarate reductase subunit FrdD [Burkholderiales bacterium]